MIFADTLAAGLEARSARLNSRRGDNAERERTYDQSAIVGMAMEATVDG
jgi:hypothetical protein